MLCSYEEIVEHVQVKLVLLVVGRKSTASRCRFVRPVSAAWPEGVSYFVSEIWSVRIQKHVDMVDISAVLI